MAQNTEIEWTDVTWNPATGCTKISPGCDHCYAERFAERWRGIPGHAYEQGFALRLHEARLRQPLRMKKPSFIFVNSMSDLFHKEIPYAFVDKVFETMEEAHWHVFQVLTKRSSRLRKYVNVRYATRPVPRHIWLGVSIEGAQQVSRLAHLQGANALTRFLSLEPLISHLPQLDLNGIHWVIVGGESGPGARPMHTDWVREIRDQCLAQDVSFFFKQWGGVRPKSGGRELDGRAWDEMPFRPQYPTLKMIAAE